MTLSPSVPGVGAVIHRSAQEHPEANTSVGPEDRRNLPLARPLSPDQERIWSLQELNPDVPVYNESEAVRLRGELDVEALERALNAIVSRHEALRSTIQAIDGRPYSIVHESWLPRLKKVDLSALPSLQKETEVRRLLIDEPRALYRLEEEPGIRATLLRLGDRDHVLLLMMHHILAGWSSRGVFWQELSALYRSFARGILVALPVRRAGGAAGKREEYARSSIEKDLAFWEENLRGAPALLDLPADRPRPPVMSYRGARERWKLSRKLTQALRNLGERETFTPSTLLAAAWNGLFYRYTGSEDILLGIPAGDREESQNAMGSILNVHALRTRLSGQMAFRELLAHTQKSIQEVDVHRSVPFDQVVRKLRPKGNPSYSPLFQVMVVWRDRDQQLPFIGLDGVEVEPLVSGSGTSKFDLTLFATDAGDEIWLEAEYSTDLFDQDRVLSMFGHLETLLEAVTSDPTRRLDDVPLLTAAERQQLLIDPNRTEVTWPDQRCLHALIEEQARRTPDAVAVVFQETQLTYRQLNERANQLAGRLRALGVGPGTLAGICLERSASMVVGLLGILKAGAAYLPLDPAYPADRLAFILQDAKPAVLVTHRRVREGIPAYPGQIVDLDSVLAPEPQFVPLPVDGSLRRDSDLAYVLYTSGSSGTPKGVQISHRALVNLLRSMQQEPGISADDTLLAVTTLSFDIAGLELFLPLISGARVVIAGSEEVSDARRLAKLLEEWRANVMQATPATWRLLLESGWSGNQSLTILCGGEPWPAELAAQLLPRCQSLWNMYGPTETTIWSSARRVQKDEPVLIGAPIANTSFYVLDAQRRPVPAGLPGELYIGGDGLAEGYLNRPELTAERFVSNPFSQDPKARLFKTGDLVRHRPGGGIEFLHRIDHQVKISGFRIELGEIEACLENHPEVAQCVVVVHEDGQGEKSLAAYLVPHSQHAPRIAALRDFLKQKLPNYMLPATIVIANQLPLTPNGKIDRKALSRRDDGAASASRAESVTPRTTLELEVAQIWEEFLGTQVSSVDDNFFELGGRSLAAVRLLTKVNTVFDAGLTIPSFLKAPTIAGMAQLLQQKSAAIREPRLIPLRAGDRPGTVFLLGSGVGICRLGQALEGPSTFAAVVPFTVSSSQQSTLDGHPGAPSLQLIASVYADLIRGSLDGGPCVLVGHSFTGLLAFEIGHQLISEGHRVDMVVLLDAWAKDVPWWWKLKSLSPARVWSKLNRMLSGLSRFTHAAGPLPGTAPQSSYLSMDEMPWDTFQRLTRNAVKGYRLSPVETRAVLFRAMESHKAHLHAFDPHLGWDGLFAGGVKSIGMPGGHSTMLLQENLPGLAGRFQEHLDELAAESGFGTEAISAVDFPLAAGA